MEIHRKIARTPRYLHLVGIISLTLFSVFSGVFFIFQIDGVMRETQSPLNLATPVSGWVRFDETEMHYQDWGNKDGAPVVLIGGTGAWSENWKNVGSALAKSGYRAIAIDLPPFGLSSSGDEGTHGLYGRDIQALRLQRVLNHLKIKRYSLVGHSFGGRATIELALLDLNNLQSLVLVDVALGFPDVEGEELAAPSAAVLAVLSLAPARNAIMRIVGNRRIYPSLLEAFVSKKETITSGVIRAYMKPLSLIGASEGFAGWANEFVNDDAIPLAKELDRLKAISCPVKIIWGQTDTITPLWQAAVIKKAFRDATLTEFKEVGHIPQIEAQEQFVRELKLFLDGAIK